MAGLLTDTCSVISLFGLSCIRWYNIDLSQYSSIIIIRTGKSGRDVRSDLGVVPASSDS